MPFWIIFFFLNAKNIIQPIFFHIGLAVQIIFFPSFWLSKQWPHLMLPQIVSSVRITYNRVWRLFWTPLQGEFVWVLNSWPCGWFEYQCNQDRHNCGVSWPSIQEGATSKLVLQVYRYNSFLQRIFSSINVPASKSIVKYI